MSIEAKATLLNAMEHDLASRITAADMSTVLSILSDNLAAFSLEQNSCTDIQADDLLEAYMSAMEYVVLNKNEVAHSYRKYA